MPISAPLPRLFRATLHHYSTHASAPPTTNLTINDVSLNEGNSGTTSFDFTVSLSSPAGTGGVTFDIATADGTATAPSDFTAQFADGADHSRWKLDLHFSVLVNGDIGNEPDETFFVNITNVTGATVTDGQGQGTIVNDEVADAAPTIASTYPSTVRRTSQLATTSRSHSASRSMLPSPGSRWFAPRAGLWQPRSAADPPLSRSTRALRSSGVKTAH